MKDAIEFEVQIRAKDIQQLKKLIKKLLKLEFKYSFHTEHGHYPRGPYVLTIYSCWGNNLSWIGEVLSHEDGSDEWNDE